MYRVRGDNEVSGGGVLQDEGFVLAALARSVAPCRILEIGTCRGLSTRFMAQAGLDIDIVTFDPQPQTTFMEPNIHQEVRCGGEAYGMFPWGTFGMAFIDGDHSRESVLDDLYMIQKMGIPLIVCHDASGDYWPGVPEALKAFGQFDPEYKWTYLPTGCGLAIGRLE
jgi:predicted O-methyltransferase YrrM